MHGRGDNCHARRATVSHNAWAPVDETHTSRRASRRRRPQTRLALAESKVRARTVLRTVEQWLSGIERNLVHVNRKYQGSRSARDAGFREPGAPLTIRIVHTRRLGRCACAT